MSPYLWLLVLLPVQIACMPKSDTRLHHNRHHNHSQLHQKRHNIHQNLVLAEEEYQEEYQEDEFNKRLDAVCRYHVEKVSDAETSCLKSHLRHIKCSEKNKTYGDDRCIQTYRNIILICDGFPSETLKLFTGCVLASEKSSMNLGGLLDTTS